MGRDRGGYDASICEARRVTDEAALTRALAAAAPPGVLTGCRIIAPGDENALMETEARSLPRRRPHARRASGAARIVARRLLGDLGFAPAALPSTATGAPQWPEGAVGSLAHDEALAVAAIGRCSDFASIGIDVEPARPLSAETLALVATPEEQAHLRDDPLAGLVLFCVKEASYKAAHPLHGEFLEYSDIVVDFAAGTARLRNGRVLTVRYALDSHVIALATA